MKKLLFVLPLLLVLLVPSCRTAAAAGTPPELKAVPTSQSAALEVVIAKINAKDPAWVDASGNVLAGAILPILSADKSAWDQLDTFYNK